MNEQHKKEPQSTSQKAAKQKYQLHTPDANQTAQVISVQPSTSSEPHTTPGANQTAQQIESAQPSTSSQVRTLTINIITNNNSNVILHF